MGPSTDRSIPDVEKEINVFDQFTKNLRIYDLTIPANVDSLPIKVTSKYFYSVLLQLTFGKRYCWATNKLLADQAHVPLREVSKYIKYLKERGLIEVEYFRIGYNRMQGRRKIWLPQGGHNACN